MEVAQRCKSKIENNEGNASNSAHALSLACDGLLMEDEGIGLLASLRATRCIRRQDTSQQAN